MQTLQSKDTGWDQDAKGVIFGSTGKQDLTLVNGKDYNGASGIGTVDSLKATVTKLSTGYQLFQNNDAYAVDFLLMGSGNHSKTEAQNLAQQVIAVADIRKDAVAFISPYRGAFLSDSAAGSVTVNSDTDITNNVLSYYSPSTSSSYAVFDSGYKYMYDRFADTFRYVPLNGDIAGTCVRTDINAFPWFSPAGTSRGAILNAVKLTYNPSKHREMFCIPTELTLSYSRLVLESFFLETRQHLLRHQHLIESMFVVSSSIWKMPSSCCKRPVV